MKNIKIILNTYMPLIIITNKLCIYFVMTDYCPIISVPAVWRTCGEGMHQSEV